MPFIDLSDGNKSVTPADNASTAQALPPLPSTAAAPSDVSAVPAAASTVVPSDNSSSAAPVSAPTAPVVPPEPPKTVTLTPTTDAEDPDKPETPEAKADLPVLGDIQVSTSTQGVRQMVGPGFNPEAPAAKTLELDSTKLEDKLAKLGELQIGSETASAPPMPELNISIPPEPQPESVLSVPEPEVVNDTLPELKPESTELPALPVVTEESKSETIEVDNNAQSKDQIWADIPSLQQKLPDAVVPVASGSGLQTKVYTIEDLLTQAISLNASDLHLSVGYRALVRVSGKLQELQSQVLDDESIRAMLTQITKDEPKFDVDSVQDLDFAFQLNDEMRFRVNVFRQRRSLAAVFRIIPSRIRNLSELRLPPKVNELTSLSQGLILVTGPTGSGKTTSLASMLNEINVKERKHIITIEDPIEYIYPKGQSLVDQRAVGEDTISWADALRSALRQDPDIVMIGEMRDLETIAATVTIAETGHLVFATLHTNTAAQSIDRMIDVFPDQQQDQIRTQLASVLMAVVSQKLVPLNNGGLRVAAEVMLATSAVRNSIRSNKVYQIDNVIQTSAELGMVTMEKSLVDMVREGVITVEQAQYYANRPDDILSLLSQN